MDKFRIDHFDLDEGVHGTRETSEGDRQSTLIPVQEGRPMQPGEELVQIGQSDEPGTVRLKTLYKHHKGPARSSSPAYREGYDAVFGKKSSDLN